ncbi:hypothetical protein H0H92_000822 [Tricholoma furcatifolium]|nr:hypothetical protein H0H92_000822 [Tricholoma furcatifolium]
MTRPFIPPLPELLNRSPAAPTQPVIPDPPSREPVPWAMQPQHAGAFPIIYPQSPYVPGGFIPPPPDMNAAPSGAILNQPPPSIRTEYLGGYGGMTPNPAMGQGPWSAPAHASAGQGWPGMAPQRSAGVPPPFYPPNPAALFPGAQYSPYPPHQGAWPVNPPNPYYGAQAGVGYNTGPVIPVPLPGQHNTPLVFGLLNFDGGAPPWGAQQMAPQMARPEHPQNFSARADKQISARVDPFMAGPGYGPVLDPFECHILNVNIIINPLLEPLKDTDDKPHLNWKMLYRSNDCFRSTDERHMSWTKGRDEPATRPRLSELRIISELLPWPTVVKAQNKTIGVTCGEIIEELATSLHLIAPESDFAALPPNRQGEVGMAYRHNRSREPGVPGGSLGEGLRRLDFLGKDFIFGGIYRDDHKLQRMHGPATLPCTYFLKCLRQYPLTPQEAQELEERQAKEEKEKAERERDEARRRDEARMRETRRPTVEDDFDDED